MCCRSDQAHIKDNSACMAPVLKRHLHFGPLSFVLCRKTHRLSALALKLVKEWFQSNKVVSIHLTDSLSCPTICYWPLISPHGICGALDSCCVPLWCPIFEVAWFPCTCSQMKCDGLRVKPTSCSIAEWC